MILDLFEEVCGARLTYSYSPSAASRPICPAAGCEKCEAFLDQLEPVIAEYHALLTTNDIFIRRTAGIGVMSAEMAIDYGCTGPVLRGSGVDRDLRRDGEPRYTQMYDGYRFEVIVQIDGHYPKDEPYPPVPPAAVLGDCWHRFYVRMLEVVQSIKLVRQGIERYSRATGPVGEPVKLNEKLPQGEAYLETEAPKGQMGFMVVGDGSAIPWRVRARSSSFCNLSVIARALPRLPDRRRAGDRRLAGHRPWRSGPVASPDESSAKRSRKGAKAQRDEGRKGHSMTENEIAKQAVDAAYKVHTTLGPGLLESVYEIVLAHELRRRGINVARQVPVSIQYEAIVFDEGFRRT